MKFHRIIGKIDPKIIEKAERALSIIFSELGIRQDNTSIGSKLGGDPLLFTLVFPMQHIATANIPTAGTDGKRYYWNPEFVLSLEPMGLRIVCMHEAWHNLYNHPNRRGIRNPRLWNIAVDFIVNWIVMDTLRKRNKDPITHFEKYLGKFITLEQAIEHFKNPLATIPGLEFDLKPLEDDNDPISLPKPDDDRELTEKEKKEIKRQAEDIKYYYADPNLTDDMLRPEKIYDLLYKACPKCPKCGKLGIYTPSGTDTSNNKECNHEYDVFGDCDVLDDHMDNKEGEEKISKRYSDAIRAAKSMAGSVPDFLERELGALTEPKIRWQDYIRAKLHRSRNGNTKNDWSRLRSRPLFAGLLSPKKKGNFAKFGCLLDTSGSMSSEDLSFALSQLQSLDERAEGTITYCDTEVRWRETVKLKKINTSTLSQLKPLGGGGTVLHEFINNYEKNIGKQDFLIILSDGYLLDNDIANMTEPTRGCPVFWVITSGTDFKAPFGRVFDLRG